MAFVHLGVGCGVPAWWRNHAILDGLCAIRQLLNKGGSKQHRLLCTDTVLSSDYRTQFGTAFSRSEQSHCHDGTKM